MRIKRAPELVLIIGPCGAGKTTYARDAYPQHAQPDYESFIRALTPDGALHYDVTLRAIAGRIQRDAARDLLKRGRAVCLTSGGATRTERATWIALAHDAGAVVLCVWLVVDEATCLARAQSDITRPTTSKGKWAQIVHNWFARYEPIDAAGELLDEYREVLWG